MIPIAISNKRLVGAAIALIIIALLLMVLCGCFGTVTTTVTTGDETELQDIAKLHGSQASIDSSKWDLCCEGHQDVEFYHSWTYYFSGSVNDGDITWRVKDSGGSELFNSKESEPNSDTKSLRGYWDCITPWRVTIVNGGTPPINYEWKLTLSCD